MKYDADIQKQIDALNAEQAERDSLRGDWDGGQTDVSKVFTRGCFMLKEGRLREVSTMNSVGLFPSNFAAMRFVRELEKRGWATLDEMTCSPSRMTDVVALRNRYGCGL